MSRRNWKPIAQKATAVALTFGHELGDFEGSRSAPDVRTALCIKCYGCCWIAFSPTRGFTAGGRLLKYQCGTNEAAGLL